MANAQAMALSAAVRVLRGITRVVAAKYTQEGADAVNQVRTGPYSVTIRVGRPGGEWGWLPIQAFMLEENWRHPFFGNRKRWYNENIRHGEKVGLITGEVVDACQPAVDTFADVYVAEKFK